MTGIERTIPDSQVMVSLGDANGPERPPTLDAAASILHRELRFIENAVRSGDTAQLLKTLDERGTAQELVQREYGGRYVFELLQNANDAAGAKGVRGAGHRVAIIVTEESLLVANEGQGFGRENVESLCTLGQSSKDPRTTLGYKGLGFKAVGEISDRPQVVSPPHRFGFSLEQAQREVGRRTGGLPPGQRLPIYAFPFPLDASALNHDAELVANLLDDNYVTVVRLPFRPGIAWERVLEHVRETVTPELLLFLDATTEITISWPGGRSCIVKRDRGARGHGRVADVGYNDQAGQRWLVFRSGDIHVPEPALVETLDRTWHRVRHVLAMVAFPLNGDCLAVEQPERPISVYFPTESRSGHSFLLNADFYLDLDRRHISETPQALPYNTWLAEQVAEFFSHSVLPELVSLYPDDYRVVHACAPVGPATGFGNEVARLLMAKLAETRFVPASGAVVTPPEARVSPVSRNAALWFQWFFNSQTVGAIDRSLVHIDVESDARAFQLIRDLGAAEVPDAAILRFLEQTPTISIQDLAEFYELIGQWMSHHSDTTRRDELKSALRECPLFYTADNRWVPATEPVFFPRARGSLDIPDGFPGNILHAACLGARESVQRVLADLGVRTFSWREVILNSLLPALRQEPTDQQIEAVRQFLRRYFDSDERGGDQEVLRQIGAVPVRARAHRRQERRWRRADQTYFSNAWLGSPELENLYGPLGEPEFLAEVIPDDPHSRDADRGFYAWLGVADRPRAKPFKTDIVLRWMPEMPQAPHDAEARQWTHYLESMTNQVEDPQGHPQTQELRTHTLDRLDIVLHSPTLKQGQALLRLLACHWPTYQPVLAGEIYCTHSHHHGERSRAIKSYAAFVLGTRAWVPARISRTTRLLRPAEVWLIKPDAPKRLRQLLPRLNVEDYPPQVHLVARELGLVEETTASADDYVHLLELLPSELPLPAPASLKKPRRRQRYEEAVENLAHWVMRKLNDTLGDPEERGANVNSAWATIPLLARVNGEPAFKAQPVVADDRRLARQLADRFDWFDGEHGWSKLISAFGLRRITKLTSVEPLPGDTLEEATERLTKHVREAEPYLLALLEAEVRSGPAQVHGRLRRFSVKVVNHLTLRVSLRGDMPEEFFVNEETYLSQTRRHGRGAIRYIEATYYCTEAAAGNYYALGPELAAFLERPTLGDGFSMILREGRTERLQFLSSKGVEPERITAMRDLLRRPEEEDSDDDVGVPNPSESSPRSGGDGPRPPDKKQQGASDERSEQSKQSTGKPDTDPRPPAPASPTPPLEKAGLKVVDARNGQLRAHGATGHESRSGGGGGSHHPNWQALETTRRLYGRRGEEAAYAAEQHRLRDAGLDPARVQWISKDDETADHDLESVDEDGQAIYIEVKSTDAADPGEPFPISSREMRFAARHRSRYFIYRVTQVREPLPTITRYRDPIGLWQNGKADADMTQVRMWLPTQDEVN